MRTIYINGKFTAQRTTGVQRLARGLLTGLDRALASHCSYPQRWVLLCPGDGEAPELRHIEVKRVRAGFGFLHGWEQCVLPWAARDGFLLNLAGTAPVIWSEQVCMLPDAAVFDHPEAYTRIFAGWYRFAFTRLARTARLSMTISAYSKHRLTQALSLPKLRLAVIPCAAEHIVGISADESVLQSNDLADRPFILAVGSSNPTKNFARLYSAFSSLPREPDLRLVIVGGTNDAVFASSGEAAPVNGVVALGHVTDAELKALYQHAIAFVFPSIYEGFGLPLLEAMSCGCPVLASRAASIPEVCGDAALYFDPHSTAEMMQAMARIIADQILCDALRRRGTERAKTFTWDAAGALLLGHLQSIGWVAPDKK